MTTIEKNRAAGFKFYAELSETERASVQAEGWNTGSQCVMFKSAGHIPGAGNWAAFYLPGSMRAYAACGRGWANDREYYDGYRHSDLKAIFDDFQEMHRMANWKDAICWTVPAWQHEAVVAAIEFMTATEVTVSMPDTGGDPDAGGDYDNVRVLKSVGYRAGPAGP